jgi:hypothetical protein
MADSVGTRFGAVLSCLSVGLPYVRKWPFTARRYQVSGMADGRCCMYGYGPNYVKFSRVFAVQLFGVFIGHYAALPPVRSDPHWPHSHTTTASIRLALTHTLQHPLLATQTSAVATTACIDYLHSHTRARRPSTASPICLYACSQRILGAAPPLAPRSRQDTATPAARDSDLGSGNQNVLGPVPEVDVVAKRPQGLLNVGTLSARMAVLHSCALGI